MVENFKFCFSKRYHVSLKFEVSVSGITEEATDFVAPLPVIGLRSDFTITPKLSSLFVICLLASGLIVFVSFETFDWNTIHGHFRFGIGLNMYRIEANGEQYPKINIVEHGIYRIVVLLEVLFLE